MNTRALFALLMLASGAAWAKPPDEVRVWTVTLRDSDGDPWCEATALGRDQLGRMYTMAVRLTEAGVDLALSYDGDLDDADQVAISFDSRRVGSAALAVRGDMDREYLGRMRHQATVIAPIPDDLFTTALAPAMRQSRELTLQLGVRRFDMALYRFDGVLRGLASCLETMRRIRPEPRSSTH
jgi:hypothetical protein